MIWAKLAKFSLEKANFYGEHEEHIYRDKNSVGVVTLQAWSQSENTNSDNEYQLLGLKYTKLRFPSFQDTGPHQSICGRYSKMPTNRKSCQVAVTLSGQRMAEIRHRQPQFSVKLMLWFPCWAVEW